MTTDPETQYCTDVFSAILCFKEFVNQGTGRADDLSYGLGPRDGAGYSGYDRRSGSGSGSGTGPGAVQTPIPQGRGDASGSGHGMNGTVSGAGTAGGEGTGDGSWGLLVRLAVAGQRGGSWS